MKYQTSILLSEEEKGMLDKLTEKLRMSKSQVIGLAIVNYNRIKVILEEDEQRKEEPQVYNYEQNSD